MKNKLTKKIMTLAMCATMLFSLAACGGSEIDTETTPFPEITGNDFQGKAVTNDIFSDYEVTIVNFWNNGCGTCIEEMPELEEMYQEFKERNINLIGVGADSGESEEKLAFAKEIINSKNVTYMNISPNIDSELYTDMIEDLFSYPTTIVVDKNGNIVGTPIVGNVKNQIDALNSRIDLAIEQNKKSE